MDEHVEDEPGEHQPEELAATPAPDAGHKECCYQRLDPVIIVQLVGYYHRPIVFEDVLEQTGTVQLDGLAKEILDHAVPSVGRGIGPRHKAFLRHGVAYLRVGMVAPVFLHRHPLYPLFDTPTYESGVLAVQRVGTHLEEAVSQLLFLGLLPLLGHLLHRGGPCLELGDGDAPYQGRRQEDSQQHEARAKHLASVGEQHGEENLDSVVEGDTRCEEKEQHRLPYLHRGARLQLSASHIFIRWRFLSLLPAM